MSDKKALVKYTEEEQRYLESIGPANVPNNENTGPVKLVINTKSKDADGNKQVIGSWHIEGTNKYFDGPITFRPVRYVNKLIRYVENANGGWDFMGHTVYFTDFRDEILDSLGGIALGRKFGRAYSDEEKEKTKKLADTYADVFGFVTFGDDEPMPVMYRVRGGKLKSMLDAFNSVPKDKRYSQYNYTLETYQEEEIDAKGKKKYKDYWSVRATPDLSQILPITPILEYDATVMEYIREINHQVLESHKKNRAKLQENASGASAKVINAEVIPPTGQLFDDEIPF